MATTSASGVARHFLFDDEHEALRARVRRFVQEEINPHADAWDDAGRFPKEMFARAGELGLFGHSVPVEYGGQGADCRLGIVVAEEMSQAHCRGLSMGFGAHAEIAMPHVYRFGTPEQKAHWLPELVAGRKVAALGVTEPGAGSNVAGLATVAVADGNGWRLSGSKMFITNSAHADVFCVAAKTTPEAGHRGVSMFLVPRETPGLEVEILPGKLGRRASDTGRLVFHDAPLAADALLGQVDRGFYQIMQCFENERLVIAAGCVGAAAGSLERTMEYIQRRVVGDGPLAAMQVTRHRMARNFMELEAARQMVHAIAWRLLNGLPSLKEVAMAKAYCSETAYRIIDDCLQLHGGYGYFREYEMERALRDMRLDRIGGGATEVMYEIISKQIGL